MNYRPADERIRLWDTWFCEHDAEGHLFYLSGQDGGLDGIGHAVSGDLLHWRERPRIVVRSADPSAWDGGDILSGNVFRLGGRWGMTYGAKHRSVQMNGLLVSDDLDRWVKAAASPVLAPQPPYESEPADTILRNPQHPVYCRDVTVTPLPDGGYEAIFTARVNRGNHQGRGAVGRAVSPDGLHWSYGEPLFHPGTINAPELPTRAEGRQGHYLLFCTTTWYDVDLGDNRRYPAPSYATCYAFSRRRDRGFSFSRDNLLAPGDSYAGRIVRFHGESLFLNHLLASRPALALPKAVRFGNRGRLTLAPWGGIDRLETGPTLTDASRAILHGCKGFTVGSLRAGDRGLLLRAEHGIATAWLPGTWGDLRLRAGLRFLGCGRAGVLLRSVVVGGLSLAVAFVIDLRRGELQVGTAQRVEFELLHFEVRHRARLRPGERRGIELEAVARSEGFDWFVDGTHLFTSVQERSTAGPIGVFVDGGALEVGGLRLVALLPEPVPEC